MHGNSTEQHVWDLPGYRTTQEHKQEINYRMHPVSPIFSYAIGHHHCNGTQGQILIMEVCFGTGVHT